MPALHDDIAHLVPLLGTWRGEGRGIYPTIDDFGYGEELTYSHVGDAYLVYEQRSWAMDSGDPVHLERGFVRPAPEPGALELVLAHPIGVVEVAHGRIDGNELTFSTDPGHVARTATGLEVTGLRRRYVIDGDSLTYTLDMATTATPMTEHLRAELRRV